MATQIPPFFGLFSLLLQGEDMESLSDDSPDLIVRKLHGEEAHLPVVIVDGGRESSSTDPVAHHMDQFTEPELHPENTHRQRSTHEEGTISIGKKS